MLGEPFWASERAVIYHGDALEVMADLRATGQHYDLLAFDPPYNVGKSYGPGATDALDADDYLAWLVRLLELGALLADQLVYFPGTVNVPACFEVLHSAGWKFERQLGWHKKEFAGDVFTSGPAMCWEPVMWATAPGAKRHWNKVFGAWGRDLFVVNATHGDPLRAIHPCPKPPEVLRWLVNLFCPEGGSVLDPTMGTGTALVAAKYLGRSSVGIDNNEVYCATAVKRLGQEVLDLGA